ncbi:unnamed protein product [Cyclocybe aegerita]|uniref:Ankyrin repeat protein n=1 Tax=Cyclocybe aegerita TaxID=1973307 RepID=A0A8S0WPZ8_CYCAE|nr:unnamed protein product [Cyclocybe aegerita]
MSSTLSDPLLPLIACGLSPAYAQQVVSCADANYSAILSEPDYYMEEYWGDSLSEEYNYPSDASALRAALVELGFQPALIDKDYMPYIKSLSPASLSHRNSPNYGKMILEGRFRRLKSGQLELLDAASDPETPSTEFDSANPTAPALSSDEAKALYPLHCAIGTTKDPSITQLIRVAYNIDAGSIRKRDDSGLTPVHVAAASWNVHALRVLLALDPSGIAEDLKDAGNRDAMTPLEALRFVMRATRESSETLLGAWDGHSDRELLCEYLVKKAMGLPLGLGEETEEEYLKKRKFGCTCGACTGGWLSRRMKFRLSAQADIQYDMLHMDIYLFKSNLPVTAVELLHVALDYIPPTVRRQIHKTFYIGFYTIFLLAEALALDARAVQFYMGKGGRVEYALDVTMDIAKKESVLGDGSFKETFDRNEAEGEEGEERRNIGLGELVCGPYMDSDEDEDGMDVDDWD